MATSHAAEQGELILSLRGICKNFGAVSALTEIDLDVHAGEVVALVGDNGAGKSTLVKVLAGVHAPTSGTITFQGNEVAMGSRTEGMRAASSESSVQARTSIATSSSW